MTVGHSKMYNNVPEGQKELTKQKPLIFNLYILSFYFADVQRSCCYILHRLQNC